MEENNYMNSEIKNKAEDDAAINETVVDEAVNQTESKTSTEAEQNQAEAQTGADSSKVQAEVEAKAKEIVEQLKELVKKGNVTHIRVRKDDTIILNLPMTVGVLGTVLGLAAAPWAVIIGAITTIGLSCTVEVEKKDGTKTVIYGKES